MALLSSEGDLLNRSYARDEVAVKRALLRRRVGDWARRLKVRPREVRIRFMTRKWGSCSTLGIITLAADLADQQPGFQDFVIAHELLHLRVPNHGRLFKASRAVTTGIPSTSSSAKLDLTTQPCLIQPVRRVSLMMSAPIRMLESRTIRTRGSDLFVDQVEDSVLVFPSIAILDLADGNIQDVAAHRFIDKS